MLMNIHMRVSEVFSATEPFDKYGSPRECTQGETLNDDAEQDHRIGGG